MININSGRLARINGHFDVMPRVRCHFRTPCARRGRIENHLAARAEQLEERIVSWISGLRIVIGAPFGPIAALEAISSGADPKGIRA